MFGCHRQKIVSVAVDDVVAVAVAVVGQKQSALHRCLYHTANSEVAVFQVVSSQECPVPEKCTHGTKRGPLVPYGKGVHILLTAT